MSSVKGGLAHQRKNYSRGEAGLEGGAPVCGVSERKMPMRRCGAGRRVERTANRAGEKVVPCTAMGSVPKTVSTLLVGPPPGHAVVVSRPIEEHFPHATPVMHPVSSSHRPNSRR